MDAGRGDIHPRNVGAPTQVPLTHPQKCSGFDFGE